MLEESLLEFPGALVLVTHDRYLLDRVSTRLLALDGDGGATFYADYEQWELGRREAAAAGCPGRRPAGQGDATQEAPAASRPKRLGYREQREWDDMESRILEAEERLEACRQAAADPAVAADHKSLDERLEALAFAQSAVEDALRPLGRAGSEGQGVGL